MDTPLTSGVEMRREYEEGVVVRLPHSGAMVRVRSVQPDALLELERIPEVLTPVIAGLMDSGQWEGSTDQDVESLRRWKALVDAIAASALVSPRVVDKPADQLADDEIRIEHLRWLDKVWLIQTIHRPLEDLAGFRLEQAGDVEPVDVAEGDAAPSKPDHEPDAVGETGV